MLTAFQQVEDQLAALRILAQQAEVQDKAVAAAFEAARIINNQYLAGTVAFTSVVVADQTALANAETAVNIRQSRLVASAALIQALGGGWDTGAAAEPRAHRRGRPAQFQPVSASGGGAGAVNDVYLLKRRQRERTSQVSCPRHAGNSAARVWLLLQPALAWRF